MKHTHLFVSLLALTCSATSFADKIPPGLLNLLPIGGTGIILNGKNAEGVPCTGSVTLWSGPGLTITVANLEPSKETDSSSFVKFQIGLGHELDKKSYSATKTVIKAKSVHKTDDQYSLDTASAVTIEKSKTGYIQSIEVELKERERSGWSTKRKTKCLFN